MVDLSSPQLLRRDVGTISVAVAQAGRRIESLDGIADLVWWSDLNMLISSWVRDEDLDDLVDVFLPSGSVDYVLRSVLEFVDSGQPLVSTHARAFADRVRAGQVRFAEPVGFVPSRLPQGLVTTMLPASLGRLPAGAVQHGFAAVMDSDSSVRLTRDDEVLLRTLVDCMFASLRRFEATDDHQFLSNVLEAKRQGDAIELGVAPSTAALVGVCMEVLRLPRWESWRAKRADWFDGVLAAFSNWS